MAVTQDQEVAQVIKDSRTNDRMVSDFFSNTPVAITCFVVLGVLILVKPWLMHMVIPVAFIWWASIISDRDRRTLPYFLPETASETDYHLPKDGAQSGYQKGQGIIFMGNAVDQYLEVWETSSAARQHHIYLGTTGAGKSEALAGRYANALLLGAGCFFSDAKGTPEQVSKLWWMARRFWRDPDFLSINYLTGGKTIRMGRRDRLSNWINPPGIASNDEINNMFMSFLPKSSGENQTFQDRAIAMFTSVTPALTDKRDLHGESLSIPKIRDTISSINNVLELALDRNKLLTERSRKILINYLNSLSNFDFAQYELAVNNGQPYEIHAEAYRMFTYAQNYFTRILNSLADTYGHIYNHVAGEVNAVDAVQNRRIVVISLPAMEKAPTELKSLAQLNLANLRAAVAYCAGQIVEGKRRERLDNLPTTSDVPSEFIFDEYGYQATPGFAIMMAQARSLGIAITIAGQDESNLRQDNNNDEADAMFGNAVLVIMSIRNVKAVADRVREIVGEADIAVDSGLDRHSGLINGYSKQQNVSIQRRHRVNGSDLASLKTGEAFMIAARTIGTIRFFPWAPLPDKAPELRLNRFLPVNLDVATLAVTPRMARNLRRLAVERIDGTNKFPLTQADLNPRNAEHKARADMQETGTPRQRWKRSIAEAAYPIAAAVRGPTTAVTPAHSGMLIHSTPPGRRSAPTEAVPSITHLDFASESPASLPPSRTAFTQLSSPAVVPQPATTGLSVQVIASAPYQPPAASAMPAAPTASQMQAPIKAPGTPIKGFFGDPSASMPQLDVVDNDSDSTVWEHPSVGQAASRTLNANVTHDPQIATNRDLDNETAAHANFDANDPACRERIEGVGMQASLARSALNGGNPNGPQIEPHDRAQTEDLSAAIQASSVYAPHKFAPRMPTSPVAVQKWLDALPRRGQSAGERQGG